jgi:elongation factor Tu
MPSSSDYHEIETEIRYLTTAEGGRQTGVASGYRGQFYYRGEDFDGFQYFPEFTDGEFIELGTSVRALVRFRQKRWDDFHSERITVGMPFEVREGVRTVGRGTVIWV